MNTLTRAEEQVMQELWKIKQGFLGDIVKEMPEPKSHSNTVATILKILIEKGFVEIEVFGRLHRYSPVISKAAYSKSRVRSLARRYFDGSFTNIVSSLVKEKNLSLEDLELLVEQLRKEENAKN